MSISAYVILFIMLFFSIITIYSIVESVVIGNYLESFDGITDSTVGSGSSVFIKTSVGSGSSAGSGSSVVGSNAPLGNIFVTDTDKINGMSGIILNVKQNDDILHIYNPDYQKQDIQVDSSKSILDNLKSIINIMRNQETEYSASNSPLGFYKSPYLNADAYVKINADYNTKNKSNYDDETLILYNLTNILKYHSNTINNIKYTLKGKM